MHNAPVGSSKQVGVDGSMTWTHTVTDQGAYIVQCPYCKTIYYLVNPPAGAIAITIDHQADSCSALIGGVAATRLT